MLRFRSDIVLKGRLGQDRRIQTTTLEGNEWRVYYIENEKIIPILLNDKKLQYPHEYLKNIDSELTFYGELRQIPVTLESGQYNCCFQARAIAYLPE